MSKKQYQIVVTFQNGHTAQKTVEYVPIRGAAFDYFETALTGTGVNPVVKIEINIKNL